jgi:hypothetical protein
MAARCPAIHHDTPRLAGDGLAWVMTERRLLDRRAVCGRCVGLVSYSTSVHVPSIFSAVQGHLRLNHPDGPVEKSARVVDYGGGTVLSWHGRLDHYDGYAGLLTLDDGRAFEVVVDGAFLRACDGAPASTVAVALANGDDG